VLQFDNEAISNSPARQARIVQTEAQEIVGSVGHGA
jgi:hypothetical protein